MGKITQTIFAFFIALLCGVLITSGAYKLLFVPFLFCIIFLLRNFCYRNLEIFLCILIFINFETFHLFPSIGQYYNYKLLIIPILFIFMLDIFLRGDFKLGKFGGWALMFFGIVILGIFVASWWGQPFILGIKDVKTSMLFLSYFLIVNQKVDIDKFIKYFLSMGLMVSVVVIIQYIVYHKFHFIHLDEEQLEMYATQVRGLRIKEGAVLITTASVVSFARYLKSQNKWYLFLFIEFFMHVMFIIKTRMLLVGIFATVLTLYLIYRRFSISTVLSTMFGIVIFAIITLQLYAAGETKLIKATKEDLQDTHGSYSARLHAYNYYFSQFKKSPFFGYGCWNYDWKKNPEARLEARGIHFSDIGIIHLIYSSGIIGVVWFIFGLIRFIKNILQQYQHIDITGYILLACTTISTIDYFLRSDTIFLFGMFLGFLSIVCKETLDRKILTVNA